MENEVKRDTVGKIASELMLKAPDSRDPIEIERALQKDYLKNLFECAEIGKKKFPFSDFFIVVHTRREPLMPNVLRNQFEARRTCPTPNYDQSVYRYDYKKEEIDYIWTIPCREAAHYLKANALEVVEAEKEILNFVLQFSDGTLRKLCKKLNGEEEHSSLLAQ